MDAVGRVAQRHGLAVFEDAAQAHGATFGGRRAGGLGTAAAFSFYPSKNLGALGDGGAICTSDPELAARARALRHLGQRRKGEHELTGWNERLDGLQAALLRAKLPHLDSWNSMRREHAARLAEMLAPTHLRTLEETPESPCIFHVFPVRTDDRDGLARRLDEAGIDTGVHYFPACHRQPPFATSDPDACPVADAWAAQQLSLPMFEHLTLGEVERVATACVTAAEALGASAHAT
jgi:dTDP-4-amino-4,6-dideoxygalactose transaminase